MQKQITAGSVGHTYAPIFPVPFQQDNHWQKNCCIATSLMLAPQCSTFT